MSGIILKYRFVYIYVSVYIYVVLLFSNLKPIIFPYKIMAFSQRKC